MPQQTNGNDCGVFVIWFMVRIMLGLRGKMESVNHTPYKRAELRTLLASNFTGRLCTTRGE